MGRDADEVLSEVLDTEGELFLPLIDGRWAWIPAVLDGRIFTHRLSVAEVEHDFLHLGPHLVPVSMLTELETYELRVHANSETRFERVLTTISALDPSSTLVRFSTPPSTRPSRRPSTRSSESTRRPGSANRSSHWPVTHRGSARTTRRGAPT
jgi:hypothetical protein